MRKPTLLKLLNHLQYQLASGLSIREGLKTFIMKNERDLFIQEVSEWFYAVEHQKNIVFWTESQGSIYQRMLFQLMTRGLQGESISSFLDELEQEVHQYLQQQIDQHISTLPLKMLFPLLGFIFPALLILMMGPIVLQFLKHF